MSPQPSFSQVFVEACRKKGITTVTDVAVLQGQASDKTLGNHLIKVGGADYRFVFADRGIAFADSAGKAGQYSWEELDFILPQDISLVNDKLRSFTSLGQIAQQTAAKAAKFCVWLLSVYCAMWVLLHIIAFFLPIIAWSNTLPHTLHVMFLGMLIGAVLFVLSIGWAPVTAIGMSIFATGGVAMALKRMLASLMQPPIRFFLSMKYGQFQNALQLVNATWIKSPRGLPTNEMLDLILLGVMLRRRGIAA